jgi:hypothetical protein
MSDYENEGAHQRIAVQAKLEEVEHQIEELERRRDELQDELAGMEETTVAA